MKRLFSIMLTLLLLLTACGGEKDVPETTGSAPAETVETTVPTTEGPEGILEEKETITVYQLVRMTHMDGNGVENWRREYDYDENGFRTAEREVTGTGEITFEMKHTADENGNRILSEVFEYGKMTSHVQYAYDEEGHLIKHEQYENGQLLFSTGYTYGEKDELLGEQIYLDGMTQSISYTYDENGNLLTQEDTLDGEAYGRMEYQYDENGNCIKSTSYAPDGTVQGRTESLWEDSTETKFYYDMDDVCYLTSVTTYDDQGNLTFQENQYTGGNTTIAEYTYEPFEIKK